MSHKLLIERTFLFDKYAILDKDHLLKKLQVIPKDRSPRKGQIYCGQVESYRPTLGAAFVNVGSETVFLSTEKRLIQGEKLLLQIQREGEKNKKARATRDLSIAGEFAVLLAAGDSIIAPKKNRDDPETKRLIDKLKAHDWKYGFLLRSRCRLSDHESILAELEELQKIMNELEADKIALLYDPTTFDRIVGDLIRQYDVAEILCNDKKYCKELQWNAMSEEIFIQHVDFLLFERYGLKIAEMINPTQGFDDFSLSVNYLEALCVIDVNSAMQDNAVRDRKILKINESAFLYILDYIDRIGLGGIVLVDFISMKAQELLMLDRYIDMQLQNFSLKGRRIKKYPLNDSGLLQLVIEKAQRSLTQLFSEECPACRGSGIVKSARAMIDDMELELHKLRYHYPNQRIQIVCPDFFTESERKIIEDIASENHMPYNIEGTKENYIKIMPTTGEKDE